MPYNQIDKNTNTRILSRLKKSSNQLNKSRVHVILLCEDGYKWNMKIYNSYGCHYTTLSFSAPPFCIC